MDCQNGGAISPRKGHHPIKKNRGKEQQVRTLVTKANLLHTEDMKGNNTDIGRVKVNKLVRNSGF